MKRIIAFFTVIMLLLSFTGCSFIAYKSNDRETTKYHNSYINDEQAKEICDPIMNDLLDCIKSGDGEPMKKHFAPGYTEADIDYDGSFKNLCSFFDGEIKACSFETKNGGGNDREGGRMRSYISCSYTLTTDKDSKYCISLSVCIVDNIGEEETGITGFLASRPDDPYNNVSYDSDCAFPISCGLTDEELTDIKSLMDKVVRCFEKKDSEALKKLFCSQALAEGETVDEGIAYAMDIYKGAILYDVDQSTRAKNYRTDLRLLTEDEGEGIRRVKKVSCYYEVETTEGAYVIFLRNVMIHGGKTEWEKLTGIEYLQVINTENIEELHWDTPLLGVYCE